MNPTRKAVLLASVLALTLAPVARAVDAPATRPAGAFPTPRDLIERARARDAEKAAGTNVAIFDLTGTVSEKASGMSLFSSKDAVTLHSLQTRLAKAATDADLKAVVVLFGPGSSMNLSQAQELAGALHAVVAAGKRVFVYADAYDTTLYVAASGASDICIMEAGELFMPGVGLGTMYFKDGLDKLGVKADYVQIGEYKGAEEPYTRSIPSDEWKGELTKLVDGLYGQIVSTLAAGRKLPEADIRAAIDDAMISGKSAKTRKLVDHLVDRDGLSALVSTELATKSLNLLPDYAAQGKEKMDFSNPFSILASLGRKTDATTRATVAIVYAEGAIVDGEGAEGLPIPLVGGSTTIGSEDIRKAMRTIAEDDNIKAVVIRIDSPGGSALASEVMWQSVRRVAATKPVIISIGSMAASGGYYLASSGQEIYADPTAIVGSIGVVGGKFVTKGLFDKLGVTQTPFTRGANASLFSADTPFTDAQKAMVRDRMKETYELFTSRVMTTRAGKIQDIDKVARGRVFVAADAVKLGMVDHIGGLSTAIARSATKAGLDAGAYDVRVVPAPKTLADLFGGDSATIDLRAAAAFHGDVGLAADSVLRLMSPAQRRGLLTQIQMFGQLQTGRPLLACPVVITGP